MVAVAFAAVSFGPARPVPAYPQTRPQAGTVVTPLGTGVQDSEFVPAAEDELLAMLNAVRDEHHLAPLSMNGVLRGVARGHSRDMALNGYIGHGSRDGESFFTRISDVVPPGTLVGENVAAAVDPVRIHAAFIHSEGHLKNILDPAFRRVGVGVATDGRLLIATEDFTN